ncbi:MAG: hypothetical protein R6V57_04840 [Vicinamibacterales bacterium]
MRYKKVTRFITVEFVKEPRGKGFEVRLVPEPVVVRCTDTVVWDVQGLPKSVAEKIAFTNFVPVEAPDRVILAKTGLAAHRMRWQPKRSVPVKAKGDRFQATLDLGSTDPGIYKYDIEYDGRTLIDPEMEIRGPR